MGSRIAMSPKAILQGCTSTPTLCLLCSEAPADSPLAPDAWDVADTCNVS